MADQKRGKWITNMDSLLQEPVEVVFSMFVSDLKGSIATIHAGLDMLSDKEMDEAKTAKLIELLQKSASHASDGVDTALNYLKARQDLKNADDKSSNI